MAIMTHAKFHFNWLMLTLIFGIWASEPPLGPGERLKRPGLIGLSQKKNAKRLFFVFLFHPDAPLVFYDNFQLCEHSLILTNFLVP